MKPPLEVEQCKVIANVSTNLQIFPETICKIKVNEFRITLHVCGTFDLVSIYHVVIYATSKVAIYICIF